MTLENYVQSLKDKKITFIGAGISNRPLIRLMLLSGCSVTVCDNRGAEKLSFEDLEFIGLGAKYRLGEDYLENLDADLIFRSPSVMPFLPQLEERAAKGAVITTEMEVFFALCPCRTIAITGSDGKTTTSSIIAELLRREGYTVHLGGNIGHPLLCELPLFGADDIAVLELSSFQLHSMACRPDVAVVTNISPNHLDKHKDFDDYVGAKKNIFLQQDADCRLVLNAGDAHCRAFAEETAAQISWFSDRTAVSAGFESDGNTVFRVSEKEKEPWLDVPLIRIPGRHNLQNYLAAFAAVDGLVSAETCRTVAQEFGGVEHRLEFVREFKGVSYINDSIASSPTRTIAGLHAFAEKPVVILGGYDKHLSFDELGDELCRNAKGIVLMGATAPQLEKAILASGAYADSRLPVYHADCMKDAVAAAAELAEPGDRVLFSPACASFDMYRNFEERGIDFKKTVTELN